VPSSELAQLPWQITGNHWVTLPCIHPADGAIHAIGVLHRGARGAVELAGGSTFLSGDAPALLRPVLRIDGREVALAERPLEWERALHWLPNFSTTIGALQVRATVFAPYGRDADISGFVYAFSLENRGSGPLAVSLSMAGVLGHRQLRVRTPVPFDDAHRAMVHGAGAVILEGSTLPGLCAVALVSDELAEASVAEAAGASPSASFALERSLTIAPGARADVAFYAAVGPERDGALATVAVMRRRGWRDLLTETRAAITTLEQSTGDREIDALINRHLVFAHFGGVGRALDDAQYYLVRSRLPWSVLGCTVRDIEALLWTLPAVQLGDAPLARELLLRMCEVHGYAPGRGVHYLDGTLFEPGFTLEGASAFAVAIDRYIRDTEDDRLVEEAAVGETLYAASDDIALRRDKRHPLYTTEVTPSGQPATLPFTLHGNAMVAVAFEVFRRTLDEESAKAVEDPAAVRAAIRRHFVLEVDGKASLAAAVDLAGRLDASDDPSASALWLPYWEAIDRTDSLYRRTVKRIGSPKQHLPQELGRLLGPDAAEVLAWLRRAPLDLGLAATDVDADGRAVGGGGDAALSGLLAYTVWYAVHVNGVR
jgi:hypothetical protein